MATIKLGNLTLGNVAIGSSTIGDTRKLVKSKIFRAQSLANHAIDKTVEKTIVRNNDNDIVAPGGGELTEWLLQNGTWNDNGVWDDTQTWND
jgi:hypothetical protein